MKGKQFIENKRKHSLEKDETEEEIESITEEYNEIKKNEEQEKSQKERNENINLREEFKDLFQQQESKVNNLLNIINDLKRERNEDKKDIHDLNNHIHDLNNHIHNLNNHIHGLNNRIYDLNHHIINIESENENYKKDINYLSKNIDKLLEEKKVLKSKIYKNENDIDELLLKIKDLEKKVLDLNKYAFSAKLRKLLKKLLEYILQKYFKTCMYYNTDDKQLSFIKVPQILKIYGENERDCLNALNTILDIIFHYSKSSDYILHVVNEQVIKKKAIKKTIEVFPKYEDFCEYFKITPKQEKILITVIPEKYFTKINDADFEEKIPILISKFCK